MKIGDPKTAVSLGVENLSTQIPTRVNTEDTPEAILEAAKAFEAVFMNEIMKSMRKTLPEDGMLNSGFASQTFNSMLDQEYSQIASKSGQLGLAHVIAQQFGVDPSDFAPATGKNELAEKMVEIDGEEIPAWALEEINDDPWEPGASQDQKAHASDEAIELTPTARGVIVTPGISSPQTSDFADPSLTQKRRARSAYQK